MAKEHSTIGKILNIDVRVEFELLSARSVFFFFSERRAFRYRGPMKYPWRIKFNPHSLWLVRALKLWAKDLYTLLGPCKDLYLACAKILQKQG